MHLILTHTDTPFRMLRENRRFDDPALHLSRADCAVFDTVSVNFALWADRRLDDGEAWEDIVRMLENALSQDYPENLRIRFSVEDARPLVKDTAARLSYLRERGVRILTPLWGGVTEIGGAHGTDTGLTRDGVRVLTRALDLGMLLDVSHASERSEEDMLALSRAAGLPPTATHSCFRAVNGIPRNLRDTTAVRVAEAGGIIGLSLFTGHIGKGGVLSHIRHATRLGIFPALALGTDFDGCDDLAGGVARAADLIHFPGDAETDTEALLHENAARFLSRNPM